MPHVWRTICWGIVFLGLLSAVTPTAGQEAAQHHDNRGAPQPATSFRLTVLHHNDGESQLLHAGGTLTDFGGVARFAALVHKLKRAAMQGETASKRGVIMLSAGDNFLAGPTFTASLQKGVPFYNSMAMERIGYDAIAIGNHEFDFGPHILADFIAGFSSAPFVSANLDFSSEPRLQALVKAERIVRRLVVGTQGESIGIVGATTPLLPFISSPRQVKVDEDVAPAVQAEVDALTAQGINKIILISHLQNLDTDLAVAPRLRGVDVMVAGGGDALLAHPTTRLLPGDTTSQPYPLMATDAEGKPVPVVTTRGGYRYVGRLIVEFDASGTIRAIDPMSEPVRVAGGAHTDAVIPEPQVQARVTEPVQQAIAGLSTRVIGETGVALDGRRQTVRTQETNAGSLIADALLFQAVQLAPRFGMPSPTVALQNGGGIRNNTVITPGTLSELDTFDMLPFSNFVAIVPRIPAAQFKDILENALSRVEHVDGRFAQVAGFRLCWSPHGTPQELDEHGNVVTPGTRVWEVVLNDGTVVVRAGEVIPDAPALTMATIDFLARGGDQYPLREAAFITLGVSYQQALVTYIRQRLGGRVIAAQYPEGGSGRIRRHGQEGSAKPTCS